MDLKSKEDHIVNNIIYQLNIIKAAICADHNSRIKKNSKKNRYVSPRMI